MFFYLKIRLHGIIQPKNIFKKLNFINFLFYLDFPDIIICLFEFQMHHRSFFFVCHKFISSVVYKRYLPWQKI